MGKPLRTTCYLVLKPKYRRHDGKVEGFTVANVLQKKTNARGVYTIETVVEVPEEVFSPKQMKVEIKAEREDVETQVKAAPAKQLKRKGAFWGS